MHVVIDDTYGPEVVTSSRFVTGARRTHVAVILPDDQVENYRQQIIGCLSEASKYVGGPLEEFHFVDIYNRKSPWDRFAASGNLAIFETFAAIYRQHRWPVHIQTIDDRTLADHGIALSGKVEVFDLADRADLSLLFLLFKIKEASDRDQPLTLIVDEGKGKPGRKFGGVIFGDWLGAYSGCFSSSANEPLLQLADFMAFCINRSTHLAMKQQRTELDVWFLQLVAGMRIDCSDLTLTTLPRNFNVDDVDAAHEIDRAAKGLGKKDK